jgi:hypothetical protein
MSGSGDTVTPAFPQGVPTQGPVNHALHRLDTKFMAIEVHSRALV